MYRIAVIGMIGAFFGMLLKKERSEYTILIGIVAGMIIFGYSVLQVKVVVDFVKSLIEKVPVKSSYFGLLLKMLGITYFCEFASNICKDAGYQSIAGQIEVFAKLAIVALSIPGLKLFLQVVELYL